MHFVCEHLSLVCQHLPLTRDFCVNVKTQALSLISGWLRCEGMALDAWRAGVR